MASKCSSCGEPIIWARTPKGNAIPIDNDPKLNGNLELVPDDDPREPPTAHSLDPNGRRGGFTVLVRHQSHFASCVNADAHRRSK